jgi:putative transposase
MYYDPEYVSAALQNWASKRGIRTDYSEPGKPQQNAYVERFNRTVHYEWLAQYLFDIIDHVQYFAARWQWNYNLERSNGYSGAS